MSCLLSMWLWQPCSVDAGGSRFLGVVDGASFLKVEPPMPWFMTLPVSNKKNKLYKSLGKFAEVIGIENYWGHLSGYEVEESQARMRNHRSWSGAILNPWGQVGASPMSDLIPEFFTMELPKWQDLQINHDISSSRPYRFRGSTFDFGSKNPITLARSVRGRRPTTESVAGNVGFLKPSPGMCIISG